MPIFTAIGLAIAGGAGFFASAIAVGLQMATSIALSYAARALSKQSNQLSKTDSFAVQGKLQAAGNVPRSFNLGYSVTAGSLVYANTWGNLDKTPNAYLTQVIALSDLPGGTLEELWVNGEKVTIGADDGILGNGIAEYTGPLGGNYMWIRYHDGTQTTADDLCVAKFGSDPNRPYASTRVGKGIAYVVVTSLVNEKLFSGFPTFKFVLSGTPLYDPSKDSSVGGSGSHRYSNPSTWGGDGDSLPAVQAYNILRGIRYDGDWVYGLQNMTAARLPAANWIAQIAKCRATITGESGPEATYRSGGQINVDSQPANAIEAILTACQGKLSELGGFYKIHVGEPDSSSFSFNDSDILSSEQQTYRPFFAIADSVNGIQATYPDPAQGWNTATAPAYNRTDLEALDGNRRLMASPAFDFVPYKAQVQRLQKSAVEEAQRARTHTLVLPPKFWAAEPGDICTWTSARNGYSTKLFRVDAVVDQANLDVGLSLTEVDPADYDWTHSTDFVPVTSGPTSLIRPDAQNVLDWFAEPWYLVDDNGITRRPAIRITWDGTLPGIVGILYEVRLASNSSDVARGRSDQYDAGALIVTQGLVGDTTYEIRGQYIPSSPRDMLWSDWITVTTPDVTLSLADFDAALKAQITNIFDAQNEQINYALQQLAATASDDVATNWLDKQRIRTEVAGRVGAVEASVETISIERENDLEAFASYRTTVTAQFNQTNASVDLLAATQADDQNAFAAYQTTVAARFAANEASIASVALTHSNDQAAFATYQTSVAASFASTNANVTSNSTAIATLQSSFSSYQTSVSASFASTNANVTTNTSAIATLNGYAAAQYAVTLNVNGYASGFNLINGGAGVSTFTIVADKIQFQLPGYNGGAPYPFLTTGTVNGTASIGIRGNMLLDGTIFANRIVAGDITATQIASGTITANKIATGTITSDSGVIGALSVKSLSIADNAVIVPLYGTCEAFAGNNLYQAVITIAVSIDTTGLSGKTLSVLLTFTGQQTTTGEDSWGAGVGINGSLVGNSFGGTTFQPAFSCSSVYTFTASGGTDTFNANALWRGRTSGIALTYGILTVAGVKR